MPQVSIYDVDNFKRRLITTTNLAELGITPDVIQSILLSKLPLLSRVLVDSNKRPILNEKGQQITIWPNGISINETTFGSYSGPTAADLGWMAYLGVGAPLIEERANIIQPVADVLSTRTYENRALVDRQFSDTLDFTIGNTISWSLAGSSDFTFAGKVSGELQAQLSKTLELSLATSIANASTQSHTRTDIMHAHKDNMGPENQDANLQSTTNTTTNTETFTESFTGTGTATGAGELMAQLMLGITGSISGSLTTTWNSSSTVSGNIPAGTSVETMATQRRQVKQYTYELPITFGGYIALHYEGLVIPFGEAYSPQLNQIDPSNVVTREINTLGLVKSGKYFRPMGIAETVSTLDVSHVIFERKAIILDVSQTLGTNRPHNFN